MSDKNYLEKVKFIVDESSGKKLADFVLSKGFDTIFVTEVMPGALDEFILEFSEKERRVLITNDKDFGELIFRLGLPHSGVILLRLKNDNSINRQKYINYLIDNFYDSLKDNFIVASEKKIRVRKKDG